MTGITDRIGPHIVLVGVAAVGKTTLGAAGPFAVLRQRSDHGAAARSDHRGSEP